MPKNHQIWSDRLKPSDWQFVCWYTRCQNKLHDGSSSTTL